MPSNALRGSKSVTTRHSAVIALVSVLLWGCPSSGLKRNTEKLTIPFVTGGVPKAITAHDLVNLRDIGASAFSDAISVSPDGAHVAFQIQQGDVSTNRYRTGWFVVSTEPAGAVTPVGDGGDVILFGEASGRIGGARLTMQAKWSPDSEWIAYRLKRDDEIQLWRSHRDGSLREQLTHNPANVAEFAWSSNGTAIFFQVGRARSAMQEALQKEGEQGFLFDDRFIVGYGTAPVFADPKRTDPLDPDHVSGLWVYDIQRNEERPASDADKGGYERQIASLRPQDVDENRAVRDVIAFDNSGAVAWLENVNPRKYAGYEPPVVVHAITLDGKEVRCEAAECTGVIQRPMWDSRGKEIFFLRREGINQTRRGVYAWNLQTNTLRVVLQTGDLIEDCESTREWLICVHESPTTPRKIVAIDPLDGSLQTVVDPNPEFAYVNFTPVEKLEWQEASGADAAGHLVYPLSYVSGMRYPLVIVQYRSKGFLLGGAGEENPIHPLAANGFFVLSFDRPVKPHVAATIGDRYLAEREDWGESLWERSATLSALEIMVDKLDKRGLIDPTRVGITGLSDGAETVWYAMIHSRYFAAASASSGGWSPSWYYLLNSASRENYFGRAAGLLPPGAGGYDRWRRISPEFHADTIDTPILVQVSDHELVASAATLGALIDAGKPIEAYVFPDEYHVKWQPRHKLAVYERTIDWFNFWLRGVEDGDPGKAAQYERWRKLKHINAESGI